MLHGVEIAFILKIQIVMYPAPVSIKLNIWLFHEQSVMTKGFMLLKIFVFTFFTAWKCEILQDMKRVGLDVQIKILVWRQTIFWWGKYKKRVTLIVKEVTRQRPRGVWTKIIYQVDIWWSKKSMRGKSFCREIFWKRVDRLYLVLDRKKWGGGRVFEYGVGLSVLVKCMIFHD
jgi:hypothetical protein